MDLNMIEQISPDLSTIKLSHAFVLVPLTKAPMLTVRPFLKVK